MYGSLKLFKFDSLKETGMYGGNMVTLYKIVRVDFPVGIKHQPMLCHRLVGFNRFRGKLADDGCKLALQRTIRTQGNKHQAAPDIDRNFVKWPVSWIKFRIVTKPRRTL